MFIIEFPTFRLNQSYQYAGRKLAFPPWGPPGRDGIQGNPGTPGNPGKASKAKIAL